MKGVRKSHQEIAAKLSRHEHTIDAAARVLMSMDKMDLARAVAFAMCEDNEFDHEKTVADAERTVSQLKSMEPS